MGIQVYGLLVDDYLIPIPCATSLGCAEENMGVANVKLTREELDELKELAETAEEI